MMVKRKVRLLVPVAVVVAALSMTTAHLPAANHCMRRQEQTTASSGVWLTSYKMPDRPGGVPESTQWADSVAGGAWLDCRVEPQRDMNYCVAYDYQDGHVLTEGYYTASDTRMAAPSDQLVIEGFDGSRIYLANGRVLEPLYDPLQEGISVGIRCEGIMYYTPYADVDGHPNQEHCYKLQAWLIEASLHGNVEQIRKALASGAHIEGTYFSSFPALQNAAMMGNLDAVAALLDSGADVNLVIGMGNTALTQAVGQGHADVVRLLLDRGAEVRDNLGEPVAEEIAQERGNQEIVEMLRDARTR